MIRDIILFLFTKLDRARAAKAFRGCAFWGGSFTDRDFRKQCCLWLKDIANQHQSCLPQITPSAFISPTGPKFTHLLYRLAKHVVVEDMKRSFIGTGIPFAEAVKLRPKDMYMADARCRVAYNKLLQIFQKEDFVIQEYEKKAQLLIKEIKQIKSEYAVLQIQSSKMKQNDQNKNDKTERIQKVRSMWTLIIEMLTSLKKEREVVDSVLEDCVGPCILDGANVVFSVPQLLALRVESDIHQLCTGNLYEGEKLNFLTVMQLLNEALRALRDERCQSELKLHLQVKGLENKVTLHNKLLHNLKEKRLQIEQEHRVSTSGSISRTQEEWEVKWKSFLGLCPFSLVLNQDTEFGLSRASPPYSFNLTEEEDKDGVFFQKWLSVSDVSDSINEVIYEKNDGALETVMDKSTPLRRWMSSVPLELSKASENGDVLIEKNLPVETCSGEKKPLPPKILKNAKDESAISEMWENAGDCVIQTVSPVKKEDPLKRARDELAEEVAKTVISESPQSGEEKGMELEELISSLALNPFLTRKQIPRTPENLLTEIRSSWRKAIQTDGSSETELTPTEVMTEEAPMDATPIMQKAADSGFGCSTHASPVPDFEPPLSERKSQLSSTEFRTPKWMKISRIIESPILETSGMQECERTKEGELTPIVLKESSVEDLASQYVEESMNTSDTCSKNDSSTIILPSDQFQRFLMDGKLHCSASPLLSSISCEAAFLQIFDEKLREELDSTDPEKSVRSESDFDGMDSKYVIDGSENKEDIQKSELDLQFSTCEVLKKTAPRSKEELQTRDGGKPVSCRSDPGLAPEEIESNEFCSTPKHFSLDEEFTKTPSPMSVSERKCSLSSLLESYQHLEEMASMVHKIPLDLIHKLEDKEQLNEKLDTKEPPSEWNL
ncbi:HAUS augmin-like complex subunit 6 isoform X1 [Egretta garzetta]|nr:HAUS augmin-like complex subunit 6 isoform X1 [Egretta garzetta]